jgi:lipopolysaccharide heptosyltransferase II
MSEKWGKAERILCVRLDGMGDLLMTTPALKALKNSRPERRITLLVSPAGAQTAPHIPEADDFIVYDAPWMKATPPREPGRNELRMIERLSRERFDAAVIFTVYSQNPLPAALLCHMAGIPLRLAHCRENPYQLLTDWVPDPEPAKGVRHEVRRQLDLVESVGCRTGEEGLSFRVPESGRALWRGLLEKDFDLTEPWAIIHPGASAPSRRYPADGFAAAADILALDHGWGILFTGSSGEQPLIEEIRGMMDASSRSLAGRLTLPELAAVISLAPAIIVNNTGPAHIAAAVGTPVVDLYALTNPQHTPWKVPQRVLYHDVPCRFCYKSVCPQTHHDCLRRVTPDMVAGAALSLLAETGARPAMNHGADAIRPPIFPLTELEV